MGHEPPAALELRGITINRGSAGEIRIFNGLDLTVRQGECVGMIGPSGCGKTTLLDAVAGLLRPQSGTIRTGNAKLRIGYMFQDYPFLPRMTAARHIAFPLRARGLPEAVVAERVDAWLNGIGLADATHRSIEALSAGMQSRVALATTLIADPELALLDEPFGALDLQTRVAMWRQLHAFRRRSAASILLVTHDINETIALCDRVVVLGRPPTGIIAERETGVARDDEVLDVLNDERSSRLFRELWSDLRSALGNENGGLH